MATTNFKVFNEAMDADRTFNDSEYEQATQRVNGVVPGMALSRQHNKMYRQWSAMSKAVADFVVEGGNNCLDSDVAGITTGLKEAVKAVAGNTEAITNAITAHNTSTTAHADLLTALKAEILLAAYPVGAIYIATTDTSPATSFGGTWERVKDRFLLAAGDAYAVGATGGEAVHTLTQAELPSYDISGTVNNADLTGTFSSYAFAQSAGGICSIPTIDPSNALDAGSVGKDCTVSINATHNHSFAVNNGGGNQAHNNMPPYLAVYVWKRTA